MFTPDEKPKSLQECFERLKKGCETLSAECNYSEDYSSFNPPATEEQIKEFESELKYPLPEAYREFLKFSNGARIMEEDIFGLDMIGMNDHYVPDGYLAISREEMTSERMAISIEDGQIYLFWELKPSSWSFEHEIMNLLNDCEDKVDEHYREVELEKRKKAGVTTEQINEELREQIRIAKMKLAKKRCVNMFLNNEKPKNVRECMERLKKAREIVVSDEYGYTEKDFEFNPPASEELIEKCENDYGFKLPEDCKEFFRISNGIRIFNTVIYGVDYIGMSDPFVPDDYLCFGRNESTSERLTFSKDGKFYLCYDFEPEPWEFEDYLLLKLEKCEELIDEHNEEVETKKRREAGITEEQERTELYDEIDRKFNEMMLKKE